LPGLKEAATCLGDSVPPLDGDPAWAAPSSLKEKIGTWRGVNVSTRQETGMVKSFRLVPTSEGPRREFKIALGLRAGYGSGGRIYDLEEAVRIAHRWMRARAARGEPFLSGMFTRGEVVYADSGGEAASHREPVAIFAG
jgi:hypothetical protein